MASPRARRKISLPALRGPTRSRKTSGYGNRLDIDHLDTQSHMAFLRKVSVNPNEIMYPINLILPNGVKQAVSFNLNNNYLKKRNFKLYSELLFLIRRVRNV